MPEFKCPRCEKCFTSKRSMQNHMNKPKPCVPVGTKIEYRCDRCLKFLSSKRRLTEHLNRQDKCKNYRHEPEVKSDITKKIEFEQQKEEMIKAMKKELNMELIKMYKKYDNINNIGTCTLLKKKLIEKHRYNLKHLKERVTLPDRIPSIIPIKNQDMGTVDEMIEQYKILKNRIKIAESEISKIEDEQEDLNLSGLSELSDNREKMLNYRKEILKNIKLSEFRALLTKKS